MAEGQEAFLTASLEIIELSIFDYNPVRSKNVSSLSDEAKLLRIDVLIQPRTYLFSNILAGSLEEFLYKSTVI